MAKSVTVRYLNDHTFTQLLTAGSHAFVADESVESGGEGLGPTPYDLLLWAVGACTAVTLIMYARRKGWPLEDISVQATHDRIPGSGAHGATERRDVVTLDIDPRGPLSAEQRGRLIEIATRCPVHKTLAAPVQIIDRLAASG